MKKLAYLLLVLVFLNLSACDRGASVTDSKGQRLSLNNKWLVVNYWADWCKPCLTELPALQKFYQDNKAKVLVLAVNFDGWNAAKINQFAEKHQLNLPMLSDFPRARYHIPDLSTLPVTFIISAQGKLVATLDGPQTKQDLEQAIQQQG